MPKPQVRELARRYGLINAEKADSQDICFVPAGHYSDMIERLMPGAAAPGDIVDVDGRVLGRHAGIVHYTIGQRRGLGIASTQPLYVVALDADSAAGDRRAALGAAPGRGSSCARSTGSATASSPTCRPGGLDDRGARPLDAPARSGAADARRRGRVPRARDRRLAGTGLRFYESLDPRARVLGGGFIAAA